MLFFSDGCAGWFAQFGTINKPCRRRFSITIEAVPLSANPILLYDGVCGLCNRLVQFTLRNDHEDLFRFASLQSSFAAQILVRHGASLCDLNTFYVVVRYGLSDESLLARSDAVGSVLEQLGGRWRVCASLWKLLPRRVGDALYNLIAQNRYRIFGKLATCPIPEQRHRHKFLGA